MTTPSPCVAHSAQHPEQELGSFLHFQSPEQQPRVMRSPAIYGAHHHANSAHARAVLQDSTESSKSISGEISGQYVQRRGQGLGQAGRQVRC
jgi:hypothetical protein